MGSIGRDFRCYSVLCRPEYPLRLLGILSSITLHSLGRPAGVMSSNTNDLVSLTVEDVASVAQVGVNVLLVLEVDERCQVQNRGSQQRESPNWEPFDKPIR